MIQMKSKRQSKNDIHICEFCKQKENCKAKPPETEWTSVLKTCQSYEEIEFDFFTGGHSR